MDICTPVSSVCSPYAWNSNSNDSGCFYREVWGIEKLLGLRHLMNNEVYIFFAADLSIHRPVSTSAFLDRARDAWLALRFSAPIIAIHTVHDDERNVFLEYHTAINVDDARAWANRTVQSFPEHKDLDELRDDVAQAQVPNKEGDQTFLYIISRSETSFSILLRVSHTHFDGPGTRIVMKRYLTFLAQSLYDPSENRVEKLNWGSEAENLTPPVPEVMSQSEVIHGPEYDATLKSILDDVCKALHHQYTFKQRNWGPGIARYITHTFTVGETTSLVRFTRSRGFTVNQLLHAALMMVCIFDNPPDASTSPQACFAPTQLVNCRHRLKDEYSGANGYPGQCIGMLPIVVPISVFVASSHKSLTEQLLDITSAVKSAYVRQKDYQSLLAASDAVYGFLRKHIEKNGFPPFSIPYFLGDGIEERYLEPTYVDAQGNNVIQVENYSRLGRGTGPELLFRAGTWGGCLKLKAFYHDYGTIGRDVHGLVDKWVEVVKLGMRAMNGVGSIARY